MPTLQYTDVGYRTLLKLYIQHILCEEGMAFMPDDGGSLFTTDQCKELRVIEQEILSEDVYNVIR